MLKNAKTALTAGDRAATVDLLEQAKQMLPTCPALQEGTTPETVLLSLDTRGGMRARNFGLGQLWVEQVVTGPTFTRVIAGRVRG